MKNPLNGSTKIILTIITMTTIAVYAHATLAERVSNNTQIINTNFANNITTVEKINNIELNLVKLFAKLGIEYIR